MSERTFVVIFFFWAALTIITPTLVHLSETAKAEQLIKGERSIDVIKARRLMMGYGKKRHIQTPKTDKKNNTQTMKILSPTPAPAPAPDIDTPTKRKAKDYIDKDISDSMESVPFKTRHYVI